VEVTWTSSKETVAYVADGLSTATGAGSAKITATAADGRKAVINIKVATLVDAMTITFITVLLSIFGGMIISATSTASFIDAWYEAVSAICTVGLTAAGTANLGTVSQCVIIAFMYFGRVGILTLSLGFLMGNKAKDRFQYADTNLLIG
jgi:trk system potassium uptake protein TrkH